MASSSSFWPEPAMPATPRISPPMAVKVTWSSLVTPSLSTTVRSLTARRSVGFTGSGRSMFRDTGRPTIMLVISWGLVSLMAMSPTKWPFRSTATRSAISMTSCSLWVMMMTDLPSAFMARRTLNSRWVSWGVRTAVGSSKIRISAPR